MPSNLIGIDQRRLFGVMALRSIGWVAAGVDHGYEQRATDCGHFVGPGAGKRHVMDRDGLAQIGEGKKRREVGVARVAGDGIAVVGTDRNAAAEAQVEPDGAVAPGKISKRLAFGQAIQGKGHGWGLSGKGVAGVMSAQAPPCQM